MTVGFMLSNEEALDVPEALRHLGPLDAEAQTLLQGLLVPQQLGKQDYLLRPGQVCRHIYLVQKGLVRSYYLQEGNEINVAFAPENTFLTDLKSVRTGQASELSLQALEPSVVLGIAKADLVSLYQQSPQIAALGRSLLESLLEKQEEYASWFTRYTARERYEQLLRQQPALVQRLALGQLASFLGVRRETLSRIRAGA